MERVGPFRRVSTASAEVGHQTASANKETKLRAPRTSLARHLQDPGDDELRASNVLFTMARTTSSAAATLTALDGPALLPPAGATSDLTNKSSQQNWYYFFISLCTIIPGVLLLLRLYTKINIVRKLDLTDCLTPPPFFHAHS